MTRALRGRVFTTLSAVVISGCAATTKYDEGYAYPFRATGEGFKVIAFAFPGKPGREILEPGRIVAGFVTIAFVMVLEIPISLVTDILTLPYDLAHLRDVGKREVKLPPKEDERAEPGEKERN